MKKILTAILICLLLLTGCKSDENTNINYSPYLNIANEYSEKFGEISKTESEYSGTYNATGLSYVNLIDLDNNGVKELIILSSEDEIEIYTIKDDEIELKGSFKLTSYKSSMAVLFSNANEKTYIISDSPLAHGIGIGLDIHELNDGVLNKVATFTKTTYLDGSETHMIDAVVVSEDEYDEKFNSFGDAENYTAHKITNMTNEEYDQLLSLVNETLTTLSKYENLII